MLGGLGPFMLGKETRHVLVDQPFFHFRNRQNVAIANDQIDVLQRDAFGIQAIVDHLLVESAGVLFARDSFLGDRERDGAVAQQAGTHIVVVGIQAENVGVLFGHLYLWTSGAGFGSSGWQAGASAFSFLAGSQIGWNGCSGCVRLPTRDCATHNAAKLRRKPSGI